MQMKPQWYTILYSLDWQNKLNKVKCWRSCRATRIFTYRLKAVQTSLMVLGNNLVIANKDKDAHKYWFSNFIVKIYLRETLTPIHTGCTRCSAVAFVVTKKKLAIIKRPLKNGWINWHIHPIEFKQQKMNELKLYDNTDEPLNITKN